MIPGNPAKHFSLLPLLPACLFIVMSAAIGSPKEFLTAKEIETIQINQDIQIRVKHYCSFAMARLKAAEERLSGKDSDEGDPFEFYTPEEMVDGYYRILQSVMFNLDDANRKSDPLMHKKVNSALKVLKNTTEDAAKELEVLKKIAEEQKKEELWDSVNKAIDITNGAHEGAASSLAKEPPEPEKKSKRK